VVRSNTTPGYQGQLHELAEQIQILQLQAREIEQRLQGISAVLNGLDQFDTAEFPTEVFTTAMIGHAPDSN
jgi:chaperonin cofactor prefoldin